jgi:4-amino-4-deoxychorismate lyase
MAFLTFPKGLESLDSLARIVKETVSAAFEEKERRQRGRSISSSDCCSSMMQARFYLTAGVGGFSLSAKECAEGSNFYCVVIERTKTETTKALRARTTPIAVKNKPFSNIKSTNYLQNCMITTDAEMHGADVGIWLANDGKVLEGPSANVAFVDDRGIFIAPKVDDVLDGVTMRRCFEFIEKGLLADVGVVECERRDCSFRELVLERRAKECMMIGSVVQCVPIEKWDDVDIGRDEGENGRNKVAVRLKELLEKDARGIRVS